MQILNRKEIYHANKKLLLDFYINDFYVMRGRLINS